MDTTSVEVKTKASIDLDVNNGKVSEYFIEDIVRSNNDSIFSQRIDFPRKFRVWTDFVAQELISKVSGVVYVEDNYDGYCSTVTVNPIYDYEYVKQEVIALILSHKPEGEIE